MDENRPTDEQPDGHPAAILAALVDGSATPQETARAQTHLATCAVCRDEVELARRGRIALLSLPQLEAPEMAAAVRAALTRERLEREGAGATATPSAPVRTGPTGRTARDGAPGRLFTRVASLAVAAALVAVVVLFAAGRFGPGGPASTSAGSAGAPAAASPRLAPVSGAFDAASLAAYSQDLARHAAGGRHNLEQAATNGTAFGSALPEGTAPPGGTACMRRQAGQLTLASRDLVTVRRATYNGEPAWIGVFLSRQGGTAGKVVVVAASVAGCHWLDSAFAVVPSATPSPASS